MTYRVFWTHGNREFGKVSDFCQICRIVFISEPSREEVHLAGSTEKQRE
jgi:hypothetical protein